MRTAILLLVLMLLLTSADGRRRQPELKKAKEVEADRTTVAQSDHIESRDETEKNVHLDTLETDKPLVFYLKSKDTK